MKKKVFIPLILAMIICFSCTENAKDDKVQDNNGVSKNKYDGEPAIAKSITYEVVIKNEDPEDVFKEFCLKEFQSEDFINNLFDMIYKGELEAYNFDDSTKLSKKDIKEIENTEGFDRSKIGMFQFNESWHFNKEQGVFVKKVKSIMMGQASYTSDGILKGYKPIFGVKFK
ncbi:MAG: hypothetical protein ACOCVN_01280 [bacterium]